jgi:hypothetical protein
VQKQQRHNRKHDVSNHRKTLNPAIHSRAGAMPSCELAQLTFKAHLYPISASTHWVQPC